MLLLDLPADALTRVAAAVDADTIESFVAAAGQGGALAQSGAPERCRPRFFLGVDCSATMLLTPAYDDASFRAIKLRCTCADNACSRHADAIADKWAIVRAEARRRALATWPQWSASALAATAGAMQHYGLICAAYDLLECEAEAHEAASHAALAGHGEAGAAYGNIHVPWAALAAAQLAASARLGAMAVRSFVGPHAFEVGPDGTHGVAVLDIAELRDGRALRLIAQLAVDSEPSTVLYPPEAAWEDEGIDEAAEVAAREAGARDALARALIAMWLPSNPRASEVRAAAERVMQFWAQVAREECLDAANAWCEWAA